MKTNDYFLEFGGFTPSGEPYFSHTQKIEHTSIPEGYALFLYKEVYIPVKEHRTTYSGGETTVQYLTSSRGSGSNPDTMDVPIHYVANSGGLRRALKYLQAQAQQSPSYAELAAERARNLRVHILPDKSRVVENESAERR